MSRKTKFHIRQFMVAAMSFCVMLAALINIPRLQDANTCVSAAFIITGAYSWFAALIWANVVLPLTKK